MDERRKNSSLRERIKFLEGQNKKLEQLYEERSLEFDTTKDRLEGEVAERNRHLDDQRKLLQAITANVPGVVFQFYASNTGEAGVRYTSAKMLDIFGLEFFDNPPLLLEKFVQNIYVDDQKSWIESVQHVVEKQIPWKWKGRYVRPSGRIIWFEGQSVPTVCENEIVFDGFLTDITEKIQQESERLEAARQQEQLKKLDSLKTMAGAIAHRFNNAMMAVEGNLELMLLTLPDGTDEYRMASNAVESARGASHVGAMMLNYVGLKPLRCQKLSLADIARESLVAFKSRFHPSIVLKFTPPEQPLYCSVDQQQIKEVLESLLMNALESFSNGAGTVDVSFGTDYFKADSFPICFQDKKAKDGIYVFCQIKDSGSGINPEKIAQIFEPFYSTKFVGRGLGLALTVGIMLKHHGSIIVESVVGHGTSIKVLLPSIAACQDLNQPPEILPQTDEAVQLSGDILLVDDEPILLIFVTMMLERIGFTVHTATNGQDAVDMVRSGDIDFCAVVLDILMPGINGIEAMAQMKKFDSTLPVLLISGYSEEDIPHHENKPDAFLVKPVQASAMRAKLEALLS